jgi:NitT/TauT family transport system ATP-binding protein
VSARTGRAGRWTGFECRDVSVRFDGRNGGLAALEDVSFAVDDGEFVCVVGPSGCGKTTLLKVIAGLLRPDAGEVAFAGPAGRPRNALVFQEHGVFPWMSVLDNVAFGLEMQGVGRRERRERALAFIESVGLGAFAGSWPHELSVGMRQRVGIARAFVSDVDLLLLDEPFGSLDAQTRRVLQEDLLRLWRDHRKLVVFVTHDIEEAILLGDRVLVMSGRPGRVLEDIPIPLVRPRGTGAREESAAREIRWHIWRRLEGDVRRDLAIAG